MASKGTKYLNFVAVTKCTELVWKSSSCDVIVAGTTKPWCRCRTMWTSHNTVSITHFIVLRLVCNWCFALFQGSFTLTEREFETWKKKSLAMHHLYHVEAKRKCVIEMIRTHLLRPAHTEKKRKRKFSLMSVTHSFTAAHIRRPG